MGRRIVTHCKRGHEFTEENTYIQPDKGKVCRTCRNERNNRERIERRDDPIHQANLRKGRAKWREKNPEYHKFHSLLNNFGITPERYYEMLEEQNHKCPICLEPLPEVRPVDHDHACCDFYKKTCGDCVRGILCPTCNQGLGQFKDNISRMERAINYIKFHRERLDSKGLTSPAQNHHRPIDSTAHSEPCPSPS